MKESKKQIDKLASERLKQRRIALGLTQKELGNAINISTVQIKKYEAGISSIPISQLYVFSKVLNTPLKHFLNPNKQEEVFKKEFKYSFEEAEDSNIVNNIAEENEKYQIDFDYVKLSKSMKEEITALIKAFIEIKNPDRRKVIVDLVKSLA